MSFSPWSGEGAHTGDCDIRRSSTVEVALEVVDFTEALKTVFTEVKSRESACPTGCRVSRSRTTDDNIVISAVNSGPYRPVSQYFNV